MSQIYGLLSFVWKNNFGAYFPNILWLDSSNFFSTVTLCMIWKGVSEGQSGFSVNVTTMTAPTAYSQHQ